MTCPREARRQLRSRDWGEEDVWMCRLCALDAVASGLFEVSRDA